MHSKHCAWRDGGAKYERKRETSKGRRRGGGDHRRANYLGQEVSGIEAGSENLRHLPVGEFVESQDAQTERNLNGVPTVWGERSRTLKI